ncbi:hypothetical protein ACF1BS_03460 [Streptomyces sp. NPDC014748]|uniref:hypothetical protein n=1 Tax=Streptomyces sp. NPDC014748 TaxID=3364905 RepID=UPI0036F8EA2B
MSPYLLSADLGSTDIGLKARAATTVDAAEALSTTLLFAEYASAVRAGDAELIEEIRGYVTSVDSSLLAELDGFDYPAAA